MATTPVLVTAWLDPPSQTDFQNGDAVTWHASFSDRMTRALVDPDIVVFQYTNPPVTNAPAVVTTTKDAVGLYHADLPLTAEGTWVLNVIAQGNPGPVAIGNATVAIHVFGAGV